MWYNVCMIKMKRFNLGITPAQYEDLIFLKNATGRDISEMIRIAIDVYVEAALKRLQERNGDIVVTYQRAGNDA